MPELAPHIPINRQRTPCADKNDRLGWNDGFALQLEGVSFGVRCNDAQLLPELRSYFPAHSSEHEGREVDVLLSFMHGGKTQRKGVVNYHLVYDAWNRAARSLEFSEALDTFRQLIRMRLTTLSRDKLYFAADVFKWRDRGLILLGATPEVVDHLMAQGAERFSDEFAQINQANLLENWGTSPLRPELLVVASEGKAKRLRNTRLAAGAAALELVSRTPATTYQAGHVLSRAAAFSLAVPSFRTVYSQPADLVRSVARTLKIR